MLPDLPVLPAAHRYGQAPAIDAVGDPPSLSRGHSGRISSESRQIAGFVIKGSASPQVLDSGRVGR
jgi:hypothetical protein